MSDEKKSKYSEILLGLLLATSALMTAWCGFQASLWGGVQAERYAEANNLSVASGRAGNVAGQLALLDVNIFIVWLQASLAGNKKLADFYEARFRPEFAKAFEIWHKTNPLHERGGHATPFTLAEYKIGKEEEMKVLDTSSNDSFIKGQKANEASDLYMRFTVLLTGVTVLVGNTQQFNRPRVRRGLIGVTIFLLLYVLLHLIRTPMLWT